MTANMRLNWSPTMAWNQMLTSFNNAENQRPMLEVGAAVYFHHVLQNPLIVKGILI